MGRSCERGRGEIGYFALYWGCMAYEVSIIDKACGEENVFPNMREAALYLGVDVEEVRGCLHMKDRWCDERYEVRKLPK